MSPVALSMNVSCTAIETPVLTTCNSIVPSTVASDRFRAQALNPGSPLRGRVEAGVRSNEPSHAVDVATAVGRERRVRGDREKRVGTRLEAGVRAVEQRLAVEVRVLRDAVDFEQKLRDFCLQVRTIVVLLISDAASTGQVADALQDVGFARQRAERDLRRVVGVLNVLRRLIEAFGLRLQVGRDGKARRIVGGGVDAQSGRELRNDVLELRLISIEVQLNRVRKNVRSNAECRHD